MGLINMTNSILIQIQSGKQFNFQGDMGKDRYQKNLFSEIWDRVENRANTKISEGQSTK